MLSIRMAFFALVVPALFAVACSDSGSSEGGSGGAGGALGVADAGDGGGINGGGGAGPGVGGSSAGSGATNPDAGGAGGRGGLPPVAIPDAGIPNLDAGIPGLIDAGMLAVCPAMPADKACGGQGTPLACIIDKSEPPQGCYCANQLWVCPDRSVQPGADAGLPIGQPTQCPANAQGTSCPMFGALCTTGNMMGGCICLSGGDAGVTWRCR
jgi:hypothetical protein